MKVPVETKLGLRGLLRPGETTESSSDLVDDLSHPGETSEKLILDQLNEAGLKVPRPASQEA